MADNRKLAEMLRGERDLSAGQIAYDRQGYPVNLNRPIVTDDEGVHTELSTTEKFGDKFVNMPTIWGGQRYDPQSDSEWNTILQNYQSAQQQGWQFPQFNTVDEAVEAAKDRSMYLNQLRPGMFGQ